MPIRFVGNLLMGVIQGYGCVFYIDDNMIKIIKKFPSSMTPIDLCSSVDGIIAASLSTESVEIISVDGILSTYFQFPLSSLNSVPKQIHFLGSTSKLLVLAEDGAVHLFSKEKVKQPTPVDLSHSSLLPFPSESLDNDIFHSPIFSLEEESHLQNDLFDFPTVSFVYLCLFIDESGI